MKIKSYSPVKYFYRKFKDMEDNQLIASRCIDNGFLEVIYWNGFFEIYLRSLKKDMVASLNLFLDLKNLLIFLENATEIDFTKLLPSDMFGVVENCKKYPFWYFKG